MLGIRVSNVVSWVSNDLRSAGKFESCPARFMRLRPRPEQSAEGSLGGESDEGSLGGESDEGSLFGSAKQPTGILAPSGRVWCCAPAFDAGLS